MSGQMTRTVGPTTRLQGVSVGEYASIPGVSRFHFQRRRKLFRRRFRVPHVFSSRWGVGSLRRDSSLLLRSAVHPCNAVQVKQLHPVLVNF